MTTQTFDDWQKELAVLIRREIKKVEQRRRSCGYPADSIPDVRFGGQIDGMRDILALVDPNPYDSSSL